MPNLIRRSMAYPRGNHQIIGGPGIGGGLPESVYEGFGAQWVAYPMSGTYPVGTTSFQMQFDIYIKSREDKWMGILGYCNSFQSGTAGGTVVAFLDNDSGGNKWNMRIANGGTWRRFTRDGLIPVGRWSKCEARWDGTTLYMTVNGVSETFDLPNVTPNDPDSQMLALGNSSASQAIGFQVKNLRFWVDGVKVLDAPCNEKSGLISQNPARPINGVISNSIIHQPPVITA